MSRVCLTKSYTNRKRWKTSMKKIKMMFRGRNLPKKCVKVAMTQQGIFSSLRRRKNSSNLSYRQMKNLLSANHSSMIWKSLMPCTASLTTRGRRGNEYSALMRLVCPQNFPFSASLITWPKNSCLSSMRSYARSMRKNLSKSAWRRSKRRSWTLEA